MFTLNELTNDDAIAAAREDGRKEAWEANAYTQVHIKRSCSSRI